MSQTTVCPTCNGLRWLSWDDDADRQDCGTCKATGVVPAAAPVSPPSGSAEDTATAFGIDHEGAESPCSPANQQQVQGTRDAEGAPDEDEDAATLAGLIVMCRDLKRRLVPFGARAEGWDSAIATLSRCASLIAAQPAARREGVERAAPPSDHAYGTPYTDSDRLDGIEWFGCLTGDCPHDTRAECEVAILGVVRSVLVERGYARLRDTERPEARELAVDLSRSTPLSPDTATASVRSAPAPEGVETLAVHPYLARRVAQALDDAIAARPVGGMRVGMPRVEVTLDLGMAQQLRAALAAPRSGDGETL
jgi:hypothetical protein